MSNLSEFVNNLLGEDTYLDSIDGQNLETTKEFLMSFDEFKNVSEINILNFPLVENQYGEPVDLTTMKIGDNTRLVGKCYLYSIGLLPNVWTKEELLAPVKDGCSISPVWYDPKIFRHKNL